MHTCQRHKEDNKGNTNPTGWGIPVWREVEIIAARHDLFKGYGVCAGEEVVAVTRCEATVDRRWRKRKGSVVGNECVVTFPRKSLYKSE